MGDIPVVGYIVSNFALSMEDGGMVAATEISTDFFQAVAGMAPSEEHADLPWEREALVALFALEVAHLDVVVFGDRVKDLLDCDSLLIRGAHFA
jgi:hypothetical protein